MKYRLQSMYNHMVGRTASVISPFYSLLPGSNPYKLYSIYMLPIAGQTVGPNGRTFFVDTQGWPGGVLGQKKFFYFFQIFFNIYFSRATPGLSASIQYKSNEAKMVGFLNRQKELENLNLSGITSI